MAMVSFSSEKLMLFYQRDVTHNDLAATIGAVDKINLTTAVKHGVKEAKVSPRRAARGLSCHPIYT
jgi:hypothetical protein